MSLQSVNTFLKMGKDSAGNPTYQVPWGKNGGNINLAANVEAVIPVPEGFNVALFSYEIGNTVLIKPDDGIALTWPTGTFTEGVEEFNPILRPCQGDTGIRMLSQSGGGVTVHFYIGNV